MSDSLAVRRDAVRISAVQKHIQRSTDVAGQGEVSNALSSGVSHVHIDLVNPESMLVIKRGTFLASGEHTCITTLRS